MIRIEPTKFAKMLFAGTIAATSLLAAGANAGAQSAAFHAGEHWNGFAQSAISAKTRGTSVLTVDALQATGFTGHLLVYGRSFAFQAAYGSDGSVDGRGDGIALHGTPTPAGNTNYAATFAYRLTGLSDSGTVDLLRMYPPDPCIPISYPPDPCKGSYISQSGAVGSVILEHNPPSEHTPPSDFVGTITFGTQVFNAVGSIAQLPNRDGSYSFQIVGQNTAPGSDAAAVHLSGALVPAVVTPCILPGDIVPCVKPGGITPCVKPGGVLAADYSMLNMSGKTLDEGIIQAAF